MKCLFVLIIIYSTSCFSQTPNPDLFQTWYLYDYYSTDNLIHNPVSAVNPQIAPQVTFTQSLDHQGTGACNIFNGTFSSPADGLLLFDDFSATLSFCNPQNLFSYEGGYFSLFQSGGQYYLSGSGNNMTLVISTPIFINYEFRNSPLHASEFDLQQTVLSPNPVDSEFFIDSQNIAIDKIEIFNAFGQTVKTVDNASNPINITDFASGLYLVKLHSESNTVIKKIVKK